MTTTTLPSFLCMTDHAKQTVTPVQLECMKYMYKKRKCMVAFEGRGKDAVFASAVLGASLGGTLLVVTSKTKINQWIKTAQLECGLTLHIKSNVVVQHASHNEPAIATIVSHRCPFRHRHLLLQQTYNTIIFDDAFVLAGVDCGWIPILEKANNVFLLTGTHMYNEHPNAVYNLLFAIGEFPNRRSFDELFPPGTWNRERLKDVLSRCTFRFYDTSHRPCIGGVSSFTRETIHLKLAEVPSLSSPSSSVSSSHHRFNNERRRRWREISIAKQPYVWPLLREQLEMIPHGQCGLIFFHHDDLAKKCSTYLKEQGVSHLYGDSKTSPAKREALRLACSYGEVKCAILKMNIFSGTDFTPGATHVFLPELYLHRSVLDRCEACVKGGHVHPSKSFWYVADQSYDVTLYQHLMLSSS